MAKTKTKANSLKIKTEKLKEMLSKSVKGASNNKLIPLTGLMCVQLEDGTLTLTTTDATNYLYVKEEKVTGNDFYVVIEVDTFSKLIARLTCEEVELTLKENSLEIVGNGTYNIALPMDENGKMIKYPDPLSDIELDSKDAVTVNMSTITSVLETVKPALAVTLEMPCYTGYYVGESIIGTDTSKLTSMAVKVFDSPVLISPEMMDLLSVMTCEKIGVIMRDNVLIFTSPDVCVYGTVLDGIEDYQIDDIRTHLETEFESVCKISKSVLLQVLDRLSLFVGLYDKNGINLTFVKDGLQISSKASDGVELINYVESSNFKEFSCLIDITMLATQVKANVSDVVTLHYGGETSALKITDGNVTQIIALMTDE